VTGNIFTVGNSANGGVDGMKFVTLTEARDDGVAVASAGPCATN